MNYSTVSVISNEPVVKNYGRIKLDASEIAATAKPGQFIMLKYWKGNVPYFMRPFSINSADRNAGTIEVLYKVVGVGTDLLRDLEAGAEVKILAPLGNWFEIKKHYKRAAVVGRGVGAAPMRYLAEELKRQGIDTYVYISASSPEYLFDQAYFEKAGCTFKQLTDDTKKVTSLFEEDLKSNKFDVAFTCGSNRLIRDLGRLMDIHGFEAYASMEEHMACGIGACKGCVITVYDEGKSEYVRVCREGPVFPIKRLVGDNV